MLESRGQVFSIAEHIDIVKAATPSALLGMSKENLEMLKTFDADAPQWLKIASPKQREEARHLIEESVAAHTLLNSAMASVQTPHEFAAPLLAKAIKESAGLDLDVNRVQVDLSGKSDFHSSQVPPASLLDAALHNHSPDKKAMFFFKPNCYVTVSGGKTIDVGLDVHEFIGLCRQLDIGKQYQAYLHNELHWADGNARDKLNKLFVNYQKAALRAASYIALCKGDIRQEHFAALMSSAGGQEPVHVDGKTLWYRSLSFNELPVHSCIIFEIADPDDESILDDLLPTVDGFANNDFIAYIPDDPDHPVKHYATVTALKARLTEQFVRRAESDSPKAPTAYQHFFSRFLRYRDRSTFYYSFTEEIPTASGKPRLWDHQTRRQKHDPDFLLQLRVLDPSGDPWVQHYDIWTTLQREFNQRIFRDARDAAVSNADADVRDEQSLLAIFLEVGLAALNVLSFAVPPLGLVMLGVSAVQLMDEVLEGLEDLSKGDREAGWEHITDVLENIGIGVATLPLLAGVHSEFTPIEMPGGQKRLWKPDLVPYRSDVSLADVEPDPQNQFAVGARHYVKVEDGVFEKVIEPATGQSRILHPNKPQAYQPIVEQDGAGEWKHALPPPSTSVEPPPAGFSNRQFRRYAVKPSELARLSPAGKGILQSADGLRRYIRNIDERGKVAVYRVKNDFTLNAESVDVLLVDSAFNELAPRRYRQVAPDQWQPQSLFGGNITDDLHETDVVSGQQPGTSGRPVWLRPPFSRELLPNGLWEPRIEVVTLNDVRHLSYDWGPFEFVPFTGRPTNIHQALAAPQFDHLPVSTDLFKSQFWSDVLNVDPQMTNTQGGGQMIFSMQRMTTSGAVDSEFNAISVWSTPNELPHQSNALLGYWAPQGGYVDIPVHPRWGEPDHVFTPGFSGCSFTVDQMGENVLRVRHVEAGKEAAQYNDLPDHEHGWGLSTAMEFPDYGLSNDESGNAYMILTGFAYMKYERTTGEWMLHYQAQYGAPTIAQYSVKDPGFFDKPTRQAKAFPQNKIIRTGSKVVKTVTDPARQSSAA
ncbi:dermonecrotic toxin domain-containing protein [Pseudomonas sp. ok266]|uniref:dermonecrotic toxin domain-containing protein n=1 Tax=Pseudomonas sp. ok266 TaxID=1761896 RepID=UPI0008CFBCAD|nr:DUF6543 domain-containing protein [Pseudomonas sp. ok266]SEN54648.1 hypothetical protein SAMN04487856_103307 [Pseudomonas sp. ok266]